MSLVLHFQYTAGEIFKDNTNLPLEADVESTDYEQRAHWQSELDPLIQRDVTVNAPSKQEAYVARAHFLALCCQNFVRGRVNQRFNWTFPTKDSDFFYGVSWPSMTKNFSWEALATGILHFNNPSSDWHFGE